MLVFITHPKYFDVKSLENKKVELIYIFNSKKLFDELSQNYKCVNIDKNGKLIDENYFPKQTIKQYHGLLEFKKGIFDYFKKKHHSHQKKRYIMKRGYKDVTYNIVLAEVRKQEKKDINQAMVVLERAIITEILGIMEFEHSQQWVKDNNKQIIYIFNLLNSFYRAYIYRFFRKRGIEIFGDLWKYNLALNIILYYPFDKYDVYKNGFHFNYLKVISRLFIEQLHRNDVKGFIKSNIKYYKEQGWL